MIGDPLGLPVRRTGIAIPGVPTAAPPPAAIVAALPIGGSPAAVPIAPVLRAAPWRPRAARGPWHHTLGLVLAVLLVGACGAASSPNPPSRSASSTVPASAAATPASPLPSRPPASFPIAIASPIPSGPVLSPMPAGPFPGGLLIADEGNGRLIVVNNAKRIVWRFPVAGSLPAGQGFRADDAFISPDARTITANEEDHQVVVRIDIATRKVVWEYGHYDRPGSAPGYLNTPDDAYPLANGNVVIADIRNCRVIEVAPDKRIVRQWGRTGVCVNHPPRTYDAPNGDTPLPDGGLLITAIGSSRVVRLDAAGRVIFNIHVPTVYPSDAQLDAHGNVVVSDYTNPGAVVALTPTGHLLWRYGPRSGPGRLDRPSLALPLPDGTIVLNDDFRHRVLVLDPRSGRILWQYGRTDVAGAGPGLLSGPDGVDLLPVGAVPGT